MLSKLKSLIRNRWIYHPLLWVVYIFLSSTKDLAYHPKFSDNLVNDAAMITFISSVVYFNLYYLVPRFLLTRKYGLYVVFFLSILLLNIYVAAFTLSVLTTPFFLTPGGFLAILIEALLVNIFTTTVTILHQSYRHEKYVKELEKKNLETEINYLKSQINPHFLFNTLNNIYFTIHEQPEVAQEIVLGLSDMLSHQLYDAHEHRVPLSKELHYLKKYVELEKIRQGEIVQVKYLFPEKSEYAAVAPLLLLPFVENAFKHGNKTEGYWVEIEAKLQGYKFHLLVRNSFQPKAPAQKNGGIGLENVRRRLDLGYPQRYKLAVKTLATEKPALVGASETAVEHIFEIDLTMQLEPFKTAENGQN